MKNMMGIEERKIMEKFREGVGKWDIGGGRWESFLHMGKSYKPTNVCLNIVGGTLYFFYCFKKLPYNQCLHVDVDVDVDVKVSIL